MTALEDSLKQFNQKEDKQQNTSDVPVQKKESYERYDPSATAGILGLTAAGLGAVALRNPIGRALSKTFSFKLPKLPASATSKQSDEVSQIVRSAPNKTERGKELITQEEAKKVLSEVELANLRSKELQKMVYQNPLSYGGNKKDGMGSALWDYIALGKGRSAKPRKAQDWIDELTSTAPGRHTSGNPDFAKINQSVKRDELWDSNLLQIDKDGRVVGGFLKYAKDKNLELSKEELLYVINKSPINQLQTKRHSTTPGFAEQADSLGSQLKNAAEGLRSKILAQQGALDEAAKARVGEDLVKLDRMRKVINEKIIMNDRLVRKGYGGSDEAPTLETYDDQLEVLGEIKNRLTNAGITIGDDFNVGLQRATDTNKTLQRGYDFFLQSNPTPRYGNYNDYRVGGGLSYHEDVVYYPGKLPFNLRIPGDYNKHYSDLANQIYHTRYQMRQGLNPNQKIIAIDEIQSDYHQKLNKVDPKRLNVVNPFGSEVEFFSANRKMKKKLDEMNAIAKKGRTMTEADRKNFYNLREDFYEIKKNTLNMANMVERTLENASGKVPYMPLYGKENWGAHAIKNTIKEAIKKGDADWVVINPVEQLHHRKRTRYMGDMEFYGNSSGKAGFKNYGKKDNVVKRNAEDNDDIPIEGNTDPNKIATIPAIMRKLAKQYNSEAKTIEVAKSDVNKPFKVVKRNWDDEKDFNRKYPKQWGFSKDDATEHVGAFKSRDEADAYAKFHGGTVEFIEQGDPRLYYKAFGIRISQDMKSKPFKAYNTGGLVVNIFA